MIRLITFTTSRNTKMEITPLQAEYLRNNHSTKSVHELASKLGVSDYKCLCWLGELGIKKNRPVRNASRVNSNEQMFEHDKSIQTI